MFLEACRFEGLRLLRSFPTVFFSLAFPVMMLVLFGSAYGNEGNDLFDGLGTVDVTVPAYMALVVAVTGLMSLPLTLAEYRDRGVLRRLRLTPISPLNLLLAQLIVNVLLTLVGIGLLVFVGAIFFDLTLAANWAIFLPLLALSVLSIYSIGLLIASWAASERTAVLVASLVYFPMIFVSGSTMPSALLPESLRAVAKGLPLTWAVELLQGAWIADVSPNWTLGIIVLAGTAALCSTLAVRLFRWG